MENCSGVIKVSCRFQRKTSLRRYEGVGSEDLYAGREGLMLKARASAGRGRAGAGVKGGMSRSIRIGIRVKGSED